MSSGQNKNTSQKGLCEVLLFKFQIVVRSIVAVLAAGFWDYSADS